jgi:hypothetical protein
MASYKYELNGELRFIRIESVAYVEYNSGQKMVTVHFSGGLSLVLTNDSEGEAEALAGEIGRKL